MSFTIGKAADTSSRHTVTLYSEQWNGSQVVLSSTILNPRQIKIAMRDNGLGCEIVVDGERLAHAVDALFPPSMRGNGQGYPHRD